MGLADGVGWVLPTEAAAATDDIDDSQKMAPAFFFLAGIHTHQNRATTMYETEQISFIKKKKKLSSIGYLTNFFVSSMMDRM